MYDVQFADSVAGVSTGLGFAIYADQPETRVGHSGECPGYRADLLIDPDRRLAAVALANSMIPAWEFTARALEIVAPAIEAAASHPAADQPTPEEQRRYLGTYEGSPGAVSGR